MVTTGFSSPTLGWAALITGIIGLLSLVFIILFFTVGQPFGTLNDICIGLAGIASGVLAWMLFSGRQTSTSGLIGLLLAIAGAAVVAIGSYLVISNIAGWYLAGLYMSAGNALIGIWLLLLNFSARGSDPWPHGLIIFGVITGIIMLLGLVTIPGIFQRIDAWEAAPWYINYIGLPSSLGYLVIYPLWCVLLGRVLLRG